MATPALETIRQNNLRAHIAVMVRPHLEPVIAGLPYYDEIISYDSKTRHRSVKAKLRLSRTLKRSGFALSIILPNSFSSAALSFMARIPQRVGYRTDGRGFLLTHAVPPPRENGKVVPISMVDRYLGLCAYLQYHISSRKTVLRFSPAARETVNDLYRKWGVKPDKPLVSLIPGASFGASKCWPAENFARLGDRLKDEHGAQVVIISGPGEEEIARQITSRMRHRSCNSGADILSLENLKVVIHDSAVVVTNDTGPRHYAVAFGTPVVVLMGPTDPRYTQYGMNKTRLLRMELDCSPCHLKVCPTDHRCMTGISVDDVVHACKELLGEEYQRETRG